MAKGKVPVRAVIFDLGGVLTAPPFGPVTVYEHELGLPPGSLLRYFRGDPVWAQVEIGDITLREFWKSVGTRARADLGAEVDVRHLAGLLLEAGAIREDRLDLVRGLRSRYRLALLTNATRESRAHWEARVPAGLFDVIVDSSAIGLRKPDRLIFEHTLDRLGVGAEEAVFIDDFEENLPQAAALGISTILFTELDACRRALAALGCGQDLSQDGFGTTT